MAKVLSDISLDNKVFNEDVDAINCKFRDCRFEGISSFTNCVLTCCEIWCLGDMHDSKIQICSLSQIDDGS